MKNKIANLLLDFVVWVLLGLFFTWLLKVDFLSKWSQGFFTAILTMTIHKIIFSKK